MWRDVEGLLFTELPGSLYIAFVELGRTHFVESLALR